MLAYVLSAGKLNASAGCQGTTAIIWKPIAPAFLRAALGDMDAVRIVGEEALSAVISFAEQHRLAGIQRLLVIAGYDAAPIDGVDGPKTQGALAAFLKNRGLTADIVQSPNFFTAMIDAVQSPSSTGLTWCNDTPHKIMAAVATDDGKAVTSRGWYRIDPGKCLHPDVTGQPKQIFSFAEAVDGDNRALKFRDRPLNWGGATQLCTRESKFEIAEQGDCGTRGLAVTGFTAVDMSSGGKTLRFAMP